MSLLPENNGDASRRVAIYIRVSTSEQNMEGYGLEAQERNLIEHIQRNQSYLFKKEWIFKDVHTGSELNRTGLNSLLEAVKAKKLDAVLVWKIDRLSRSLKHLLNVFEQLEENNVSFISIQENIDFKGPIGKLIFQIFGAIAQFERELIKGRTYAGKLTSAKLGNFTGSYVPYGYSFIKNPQGKGKRLIILPEEKKWIQEIFNWYIYDGLGFGEIKSKLNRLKVPVGKHTKSTSGNWTERVIRKMIHNSIYRGEFIAFDKDENGKPLPEDEYTIVSVPPCISELVFLQAQEVCKKKKATDGNRNYLLSGKITDISITPNKKFVGCKRTKGGFSYRRKQFNSSDGTHFQVFEIPGKQLDEYVWGKIKEALKDPQVFIKKYLSKEYTNASRIQQLEESINNLRQFQANKELEIIRIEAAFEKGIYGEEKTKEKISQKNKELNDAASQINDLKSELSLIGQIDMEVMKLKDASEQIKYKIDKLNKDQKKVLVRLFVENITLNRVMVDGIWRIDAEVTFRFNPQRFPNHLIEDRTEKSLVEDLKSKESPKKDDTGAAFRT